MTVRSETWPSLTVAVHGLGYVGTVTAACLADRGHRVIGVDVDEAKVAQLRAGVPPVLEPGLAELVARGTSSGQLVAVDHGRGRMGEQALDADVHLICVGTPSGPDGAPDLSAVETVVTDIGLALAGRRDAADADASSFPVVVIRSTVLPGTVDRMATRLQQTSGLRAGLDIGLAMCPEFLREASAVADFFDPPFTVAGVSDPRTADVVRNVFAFLDRPLHVVSIPTAETVKYACNAFHAMKVAFANEIGRFALASGAHGQTVMEVLCDDDRLNISPVYLRPGFPFGGSCLPKDLRALACWGRQLDLELPLLTNVLASNERHLAHIVDLVLAQRPRRVALLGLAFKSGTDDLRESPYVSLAERLIGSGVDVAIWDPDLDPERLMGRNRWFVDVRLPELARLLRPSVDEVVAGADVCVSSTDDRRAIAALAARPQLQVIDASASVLPDERSNGRDVAGTVR